MTSPVNKGDVLAQKYRVEQILGQGGMGVVVAATHLQLGQKVALKFMLPAATEVPGAAERFLREARAAVRLRSENVARVIDVGTLDSGSPYMVMEFLEGKDLGEVLQERGPLPYAEAVDYVIQACSAMADAHEQGVVHRDLKPENLFLARRPDGRPIIKVLDFGISKLLSSEGPSELSATKTGIAMGSPAYMAPEQMRSAKDADSRADIWSLGAMLYHLVTGHLPFSAETFTEMMAKVLTEEHIDIRTVSPNIPPPIAHAVAGCLQRDRERRIQSVVELASYLAPCASHEGQLIAHSLAPGIAGHDRAQIGGGLPGGPAPSAFAPVAGMGTPIPGSMGTAGPASPLVGPTPTSGQVYGAPPAPKKTGLFVIGAAVVGAAIAAVIVVSVVGSKEPATTPSVVPASGAVAPETTSPPSKTPENGDVAAQKAADAGVVAKDATIQETTTPPAVIIDAAPPDAAKKKTIKKKRRRRRDDDPFGSIH